MKQFFNYFRALNFTPKPKRVQFVAIFAGVLIFYLNFIFAILEAENPIAVVLSFLCSFVFLSGLILSNYFGSSPNLYSLIPISSKKSLLYRFLSVLFMFVLMVVIAVAVFAFITLIAFLFSLIPACNGEAELPDDGLNFPEAVYYPIGLYGGLFFAAYFILMYASGMIIGLCKKRKSRNIYTVCLFVGLFISMMATATSSDFVAPFVNACFEAMALPWLCILYWFILAFAMLGAAIFMGVKYYNPKKF